MMYLNYDNVIDKLSEESIEFLAKVLKLKDNSRYTLKKEFKQITLETTECFMAANPDLNSEATNVYLWLSYVEDCLNICYGAYSKECWNKVENLHQDLYNYIVYAKIINSSNYKEVTKELVNIYQKLASIVKYIYEDSGYTEVESMTQYISYIGEIRINAGSERTIKKLKGECAKTVGGGLATVASVFTGGLAGLALLAGGLTVSVTQGLRRKKVENALDVVNKYNEKIIYYGLYFTMLVYCIKQDFFTGNKYKN